MVISTNLATLEYECDYTTDADHKEKATKLLKHELESAVSFYVKNEAAILV